MTKMTRDAEVVVITGGAGFLGRAIVRELQKPSGELSKPPREIRVFDTRPVDGEAFGLTEGEGLVSIVGDIREVDQVREAFRGADAVIHCASLVDWGNVSEQVLHDVNVVGTWNVVEAARVEKVAALVYTSTMDVVYPRKPICDGDESLPYPEQFADAYAHTKAQAEQAVLAAWDYELPICVIRPCGMWGEADPYHVTQVLRTAQKGKLSHRMGDGSARFQHVYVGNVAHAHVLALRSLLSDEQAAAGEVYIITDTEAENFFDFLAPILEGLGHPLPPRSKYIPFAAAWVMGAAIEVGAKLARPFVSFTPVMTRSSVQIICQDFTFTGEKARRELGYEPIYSKEEGIERTIAHFARHGPNPD